MSTENVEKEKCLQFVHGSSKAEITTFDRPVPFLEELERRGGCDVALLDICMPGISGIEVAKEIRARRDKTEIIFLTTSNEFAVEAFDVGAIHYLLKPFSAGDFDGAVDRAMKRIATARGKKIKINGGGGALEYMKEYEESIAVGSLTTYCANEVANAVFRCSERRCEQHGMDFRVQAAIPGELPYTSVECGTLFGNLMENACDAAQKCGQGFVEVTAECKRGRLCIQIRNSVGVQVKFEDGIPLSTKEEGGGIGVRSVLEILSRYNGMIRMEQEGDVFLTQIIQPLQ